jgi:hypothetical protein
MLSWISGTYKASTAKPKRAEGSGSARVEYRDIIPRPLPTESNSALGARSANSVTYAARDKKNGVELVCSAPAGSQHAAKVLELCSLIYSSGARGSKQDQRQITTQPRLAVEQRYAVDRTGIDDDQDSEGDPYNENEPESKDKPEIIERFPRTAAAKHTMSTAWSGRHESQHYAGRDQASARAREGVRHAPETPPQYSHSGKSRHPPTPSVGVGSDFSDRGTSVVVDGRASRVPASLKSRHQPEPQPRLHQGYRHESGTQTTYHASSQKGELFVSAPNGTGEAKLFDEVARRAGRRDCVSTPPLRADVLQSE